MQHLISNLRSWFLLIFPYKREATVIKSQLLIPKISILKPLYNNKQTISNNS